MTASPTMLTLRDRLDRVVLYQAYPQSFADADGDGMGDLDGVAARLDYLAWLGVDAVWLNPCFVSPMRDAGYDVADFDHVDPRYGGDAALDRLIAAADERGIAIVLDLVAGHTSDRHPWFLASADDPADDRYVWSPTPAPGFVAGPGARGHFYKPNFFEFQPALNFGFARTDPSEPWRQPVDAAGPRRNRDALVEIISRWYDRGVQGFRVDMAASLVKDDPGHVETGRLWAEVRARLDARHPGNILISEWGDPARAVPAGFDVDFFLQFGGDDDGAPLKSLWNNGAGTVHEAWGEPAAWADAAGTGDAAVFVAAWERAAAAIAAAGSTGIPGLPTANHDFTRLVAGGRDAEQARSALLLALTWPALPSIYYGDEIGMRYVPGLASLEGSSLGPTYERAGSRTPMQWGELPGTAAPAFESRYLPQDPDPLRPTVADQLEDPESLLRFVRAAIAVRRADERLSARAPVAVRTTGYPFVFTRGSLLVALNPSDTPREVDLSGDIGDTDATLPVAFRAEIAGGILRLDAFGCAVVDLAPVPTPTER
ncbi:alpha-amylase family glycosyl hydrolase [Microbacterium sp. PA5]|uniref:alpha-amylase family glycosyl hydrolase n=1 Tax=Microbacterium sp. PA5 TaxID=3416654 RepID=UPI003CFB441A